MARALSATSRQRVWSSAESWAGGSGGWGPSDARAGTVPDFELTARAVGVEEDGGSAVAAGALDVGWEPGDEVGGSPVCARIVWLERVRRKASALRLSSVKDCRSH